MGTNTGIGIGIGIPFKNNALGGDRPYLPPELKARLIGVWDNYGKKNTDADRNIIKNKIPNAGGDLEILNAAYKLNSGFGEYKEDFTSWRIYPNIEVTDNVITTNGNFNSSWFIYKHANENEINEMNIKVSGIPEGGIIRYFYIPDETATIPVSYNISEDGVYHLPKSKLSSNRVSIGFTVSSSYDWNNIRIEQLSDFGGAFVTDGIDDLITSTKTVQEMGITDEVTIVSMIHQIDKPSNFITTNNIRTSGSVVGRNAISLTDKTGIYGWYKDNIQGSTINVINNILGDKANYTASASSNTNLSSKFSVVGYISNGSIVETSQVAWYWTIIANKVLTTDQINQVIAYFNLDRTLKSDIYCNIAKQGITNENHAEFGDTLIDFSGNGRDIQLNNIAWKGDSGIGKYEVDFASLDYNNTTSVFTATYKSCSISKIIKDGVGNIFYNWGQTLAAINSTKIQVIGLDEIGAILEFMYLDESGNSTTKQYSTDGIYDLPASAAYQGDSHNTNFRISIRGYIGDCDITITQIPSHAGSICLDGVNDYGQYVGDLGLKDYTLIMNRAYSKLIKGQVPLISSNMIENNTPFIVEHWNPDSNVISFSYGASHTTDIPIDINKKIIYQSTYSYLGDPITRGDATSTGKGITLGKFGDGAQYSAICLWSLMLFPYSMSEFLIERQLKKHKLGTLYPDMVEFRPVINSNVLLDSKPTFVIRGTSTHLNAGDYVPENSQIWVSIKMNNIADRITKFTVNGKTIDIPENAYSEVTLQYGFPFVIDKSPQKIGITIEQDENYVLFNPVINSNYDNYKLTFHLREYEKLINIGDYIPKGTYIRANLYLKNNIDELVTFTFNGVNIDYAKSPVLDTAYNIRQIYNYDSPQEVNITIDEYIRYEDIVQPYPVLLRFKDENGNEVS